MSNWEGLRDRIAGKWQLPLLAVALVALGAAVLRVAPTQKNISLDRAIAYIVSFEPTEQYDVAIKLAEVQLGLEGRTEREVAPLHLHLARALYGRAVRDRTATPDLGSQVVIHYTKAVDFGQPLEASDLERLARAHEWQRQYAIAVDYYEQAAIAGVQSAADLRKHGLVLQRKHLGLASADYGPALDAFMNQVPAHRLDLRIWAVEQRLRGLEEIGGIEHAPIVLSRVKEQFADTDFADRFAFLEARILFATGHIDEAERLLRTIRNRVDRNDDVHAMTGWLLGRAVLGVDEPQRPQEALAFFTDVIHYHVDHPYGVASRVGAAEALTALERFDEAVEAYDLAIGGLVGLDDPYPLKPDTLRVSLGVIADAQQRLGNLHAAVGFAKLALRLVSRDNLEQYTLALEQLAESQVQYASVLAGLAPGPFEDSSLPAEATAPETVRALTRAAAGGFLEIARITTLDEGRVSRAFWRAAGLYRRAGDMERAAALYEQFVHERPQDSRVSGAWFRLGALWRDLGQLAKSVDAYQECYRRYPRTLDGSRALIPLAYAYMESGPGEYDLAEKTLHLVLDDSEVFTPRAPEFAEALFLLGDLLSRQGEVDRAITILEEAVERYPNDPRVLNARFLLADSYRQSALALQAEASLARIPREIRYMRTEADSRFGRARQLYRALIDDYAHREPDRMDRRERLYLRLAHLYEADCLFELRSYKPALKLYEEAAGTYRETPSALAAYTQIINCHVFLQQPQEARATLARARILVDAIAQDAFDESISPERREDWKRYFDWLAESNLF